MNNEQVELWNNTVGEAWVRHVDQFDATLEPFGRAALDAVRPADGERILDVGCGVGTTTLEIAADLARSEVIGIDISAPMLAEARRRATARGISNIEFVEADVQTADLGAASFDVVFSRFGVMFFSDPLAAFSNLASSMTTAGRLGLVCFAAPSGNPFMMLRVVAAAEHLGATPPAPTAPGPFSLADADRTAELLQQAGFVDITIAPGPDEAVLHGADDLEALALRLLEQNPGTAPGLATVDGARRAAAIEATVEALRPHRRGDEIRLGAATHVVTARAMSA